jgi:hypothetical protein
VNQRLVRNWRTNQNAVPAPNHCEAGNESCNPITTFCIESHQDHFSAIIGAGCVSSGGNHNAGDIRGNPTGPSQSIGTLGRVNVTRVRAFIVNDRLQAFVEGEIGDGCTALHSITQERSGN